MNDNPVTINDIKKHIKKCNRYRKGFYNWLGFVESKTLSQEVELLFSFGNHGYDWVNGNEKLHELIKEVSK